MQKKIEEMNMGSVKFEKGSSEWYMFQEYWKLCQEFWIPEEKDSYWDNLIMRAKLFMKKYRDINLAKELALSLIENLESRR